MKFYLNRIWVLFSTSKGTILTCLLVSLFLSSCDSLPIDKSPKELVLQSSFISIPVIEEEVPEIVDSVIIHIGTFLGNEKRNYSGNFQSDSLNELWKTDLGSGVTIVSASKGEEVWKGAGWTGQPLIVQEKEELFIIQGSFDHGLKKIRARDGEILWSYPYDDIIKGTGTIYKNDTAADPNHRILIMQGSRLGNENHLSSKEVWSYRAISYFTGEEVWRMNIERGKSYSRDVDASALIINDTAYLGLENGSFVVFDPSNREEFVNKDQVYQTPVIHKKVLLYDKKDIKSHRGNLVTEASPCRIGNRVYIASGSGHVYGYHLIKQEIDWDFHIGSDLDGTTIVTEDSCLLVPIEKQYIKGHGGVMKLNPRKPDTACVEWFFPTKDNNYSSWKGGVIGSPAVNEQYKSSFEEHSYAAFTGIDGNLYVVDLSELSEEIVEGPNKKQNYPQPKLVFKKHIGPSISTPVFSEGRLMAAGYRGIYVFKYDLGEFIQTDYRKGNFEATPAVHNGRVYIASRNGYIYCLGSSMDDLANNHSLIDEDELLVTENVSTQKTSKKENRVEVTKNKKYTKKVEVNPGAPQNEIVNNSTTNKAFVIVGSFSKVKNANKLVDQLQGKGYMNAQITRVSKSGYHRVALNGFESLEAATTKLAEIKNEYPNSWVMQEI